LSADPIRWPARLVLTAARDGAGATRVHARHDGPLRLLKTLYPEGAGIAHAVLVHPPGGLVGGDRLDIQLDLQAGAHLLVTTPAATRFYRSNAGEAMQAG
jgi:urease accessory protein